MDIWMVFGQNRQNSLDAGSYQLASIRGELESTINEAEKLTMELAIAARELQDDRQALEAYIYKEKAELLQEDFGVFNVYLGNEDWIYIPDFEIPEDYVTTERIWYVGAMRRGGGTYVSPPYQDAMTGDICYTVSVLMGDGHTVLGVDYTMENIQDHIAQMYKAGSGNAFIVTEDGIIAGAREEDLIGQKLLKRLPAYAGIYSLARNREGVVTARIRSGLLYEHLFATQSGNGWYLIVSVDDWDLYRSSYLQLTLTLILSFALFSVIIILYLRAARNSKQVQEALQSKEEFLEGITSQLREPLDRILEFTDPEISQQESGFQEHLAGIHAAGEHLSDMIGQIISYSNIVRTEKKNEGAVFETRAGQRKFRVLILGLMLTVMVISIYTNISAAYRWGNVVLRNEAERYEFRVTEWVDSQKGLLDMFSSIISTNPEMLDDYEGTVAYLNRITQQYPEISVSYMTNPYREHTVYMNNGWEPDEDWHVEERQWYIDTLDSSDNFNVSEPYYDEQTGAYCVTISKRVYDNKTGEFLGIFGIDFFMDKLVDILGGSYSGEGYAFLVDTSGNIINHPYGSYQMSQERKTNVSELQYGTVITDGKSTRFLRDYDNNLRIFLATKNETTRFTVYVAADVWDIYGRVLIYAMIGIVTFCICILTLYRLLADMIKWQDRTNKQIKESADAAIAAGKAKSQFLAQMSHEIRTPINAVLGMNEMILREARSSEIIEYSENIRTAGKTLLSLINSILDFSKIEDGKMEILPVEYDTASLIGNLVNSISERARNKGLELIIKADETLPSRLLGDDVRISQVIMNLLTNAVKYTKEGSITISFGMASKEENRIDLAVSVQDTGIGIRKEDMDRLFASFERIDEKKNRNIEGTGLGMSIVTKLLAMMGSSLQVESRYGVGSTFSFVLSQRIIDDTPMGDYEERLAALQGNSSRKNLVFAPGALVLVVDDNEMNRKVAGNLLKLCGISADIAKGGEEAIRMTLQRRYDLILLDIMMPGMDGLETLNRMREDATISKNCVVIALTANAIVGAREMYISSGFDDYLSKPIDVDMLSDKLAKHLPKDLLKSRQTEPVPDIEVLEFLPVDEEDELPAQSVDHTEVEWRLKDLGVGVEDGLRYSGGDWELYIGILKDYIFGFSEKSLELDGYFEAGDLENYQILVHALKSNAKMIGLPDLYEKAKELEEMSGGAPEDFPVQKHKVFLTEYKKMAIEIGKVLWEEH